VGTDGVTVLHVGENASASLTCRMLLLFSLVMYGNEGRNVLLAGCMRSPCPNSLRMTAIRWPCCAVRMWFMSVVLPEPRNPVTIVTCTQQRVVHTHNARTRQQAHVSVLQQQHRQLYPTRPRVHEFTNERKCGRARDVYACARQVPTTMLAKRHSSSQARWMG
jgi:hypothetical protein